MLKILAVIECDGCNGVLSNIAVAEKTEQLPHELSVLQVTAERRAWHQPRNSIVHYCPECMHPAEQ